MTTSSSFAREIAAFPWLAALASLALAWPGVALARTWFTIRLHLCIEPLARVAPDPLERSQFQTQGIGSFIVGETQEILHFHHVTPVRLDLFQLFEQVVDTERRFHFAAIGGQEVFESFQR